MAPKYPGSSSTRRFRSLAALFSLLVVSAMLLAACGGTANNSSGSQSQTKHVLTLVDAPKGDFTSLFNPFTDPQTSRYGSQGFLYETMVYYNRIDGSVKPWLASSYKQAPDLTSITFSIRPGVRWSDGQGTLTSDDVVFTLNLMKQYPALDIKGIWKTLIKSVSATDPNTVEVQLQHPDSTALWYIGGQTFIVPKHAWQGVSDPVKYTNDKPVVTGPFTLKSFSSQIFVYQKNPNYWQPGLPKVDEIRLPALNSNTSANLLLARGDLDWAGVGYDPKLDSIFVNKDPQHNHHWFPPSNVVTLYPNLKKYPFNVTAVRQAMSLAIDRQELQDKANPYAPPASLTALVLPQSQDFLDPAYANLQHTTVDAAKADSLLKGAGFTKGSDGIYADKNGKKLSFNLNVVNGWSDWQSDCALIAKDLKAIGMDVHVNALGDFAPYFAAMQKGDFDVTISWTNPGPTPYYLYHDMLSSAQTAPIGQAASTNFERWQDSKTDQLLQQYTSSPDPAAQKQAIAGLEKVMVEQLPTIPLTYNPFWNEYRTSRFVGWPDQTNPFAVPSPTNYPDNEYIILHLKPAA